MAGQGSRSAAYVPPGGDLRRKRPPRAHVSRPASEDRQHRHDKARASSSRGVLTGSQAPSRARNPHGAEAAPPDHLALAACRTPMNALGHQALAHQLSHFPWTPLVRRRDFIGPIRAIQEFWGAYPGAAGASLAGERTRRR